MKKRKLNPQLTGVVLFISFLHAFVFAFVWLGLLVICMLWHVCCVAFMLIAVTFQLLFLSAYCNGVRTVFGVCSSARYYVLEGKDVTCFKNLHVCFTFLNAAV